MAGALIPLVMAVAPDIIKLIVGLVHKQAPIAEANNGPGTGPVKFAEVFGTVITALQNAAAAGQIPKQLPSDEAIKAIIEAVVSSMKSSGVIGGVTTAVGGMSPVSVTMGGVQITIQAVK